MPPQSWWSLPFCVFCLSFGHIFPISPSEVLFYLFIYLFLSIKFQIIFQVLHIFFVFVQVKELTEQFLAATPLALVLKQFLADRSLDQSYSGGLSSHCLVSNAALVIFFELACSVTKEAA